MKLQVQWGLLVLGWMLSTLAIKLWPQVREINSTLPEVNEMSATTKEDLLSLLLFKPFHYLFSFMMLLIFMVIVYHLTKKVVYECRIAYLFRSFPYEPVLLQLGVILLYSKVFQFFSLLTPILSVALMVYYVLTELPLRKKEAVYVKEG